MLKKRVSNNIGGVCYLPVSLIVASGRRLFFTDLVGESIDDAAGVEVSPMSY